MTAAAAALLARLQLRRPGRALPREYYVGAADYQTDLELIWYRDWLFAGHEAELGPQEHVTLQVGDYPLLLVRDRDGELRAFHNTCRHRGSRICSAERGTAARLVCPYHSWTYQLDGRLIAARDMGAEFDPAAHALRPVRCERVGGFVFVSLAASPPDFEPVRRHLEPYLAPHRLPHAKVAFQNTITVRANWKLVWENNRECYHCGANHPELLRSFADDPTLTATEGGAARSSVKDAWQRWESAGLPSRYAIGPRHQYRTMRLPLREGCVSMTLSGAAAVRRRLSDGITEPAIGSLLLYHYPSTWNHVLGDHAVSFRVLPLGPMETQLRTQWLVHRDAVEGLDYRTDELTAVWSATNEADRRIIEENQIGVRSPAYDPAPYSPLHEGAVTQFVDWYCTTLEGRLRADEF